jgi:hypothetical protein
MNIRLIIPNQYDNGSNGYHHADPIGLYGKRIADIAGGFTSWTGIGGWKDSQGVLESEPVTIVEASVPKLPNNGPLSRRMEQENVNARTECFRQLAADIAKDLNQDCVYLSIDGEVEYVKP